MRPDDIAEAIPCGDSVDAVVSAVQELADAGFTHVALCQIGGDHQAGFWSGGRKTWGCPRCRRRRKVMPQSAWSAKRERQYEHIEQGLEERGRPPKVAKEIASRTVNKERARAGEAREASRISTDDISSGRRGGLRSHHGSAGRTRDQLYQEAKRRNIKGRSKMSKGQLESALGGR